MSIVILAKNIIQDKQQHHVGEKQKIKEWMRK
jgi:hypothetical protein